MVGCVLRPRWLLRLLLRVAAAGVVVPAAALLGGADADVADGVRGCLRILRIGHR